MNESPRIAFAWNGLPPYGARLIRAAVESVGEPVAVIGTRSAAAFKDVESILGHPVEWIDADRPVAWNNLRLRPPELFIQSSWATPSFNALTREVKEAGGKVVVMVDNRWKNNLRQWLGALYFRLRLRKLYDAAWVPGASSRQLCRMLGLPNNRIFGFLYSGWSERFPAGPPLDERPLRMLFVGQYIHRKGLDLLIDAWRRFTATHPQWELALYGAGELQAQLERELPQAIVHPFQQTDEIAAAMRSARFFVLPAREDHWPLVVHESATSGCALVLSTNIGNLGELTSPRNAITFPSGSADGLHSALCQAAGKDAAWLEQAGPESRRRAAEFGPDKFAATFREVCATLLSQPPKTR